MWTDEYNYPETHSVFKAFLDKTKAEETLEELRDSMDGGTFWDYKTSYSLEVFDVS